MSFSEFIAESKGLVSDALESLGYPKLTELEWAEPREAEYGDLSFRVGFELAKQAKKRPSEIASEIADRAKGSLSTKKYVAVIEAHASGFLNVRINDEAFLPDVLLGARAESYGRIKTGEGKRILIEHTSVNPSKALHVGHLRNTAIGDSLARIFSFASYKTSVLNYIDDSGLQVADVLVGMKFLGFSEEAPEGRKYDHYAGDPVYTEVTKRYELDPALKEKQSIVLKQIEERDASIIDLALRVTDKILREQLKTCWRFGAFYDLLVYESDIIGSKLWEDLFSELKAKGIARYETEGKLEGCWVVTVKGESEGEDKVLVRSNGTATYVAKDTPFAALKMGLIKDRFSYSTYTTQPNGKVLYRTGSSNDASALGKSPVEWGPDRSFTPIDNRQGRLQRIIQYILSELAKQDLRERYVHVGYEIVSLTPRTAEAIGIKEEAVEGKKKMITMAGRKGLFVNADDAIDALKKRAVEETVKRNPDNNDPRWVDKVSEAIAISALRFQLLKQDLDKIIVFDLEEALKLVGETGPYLLYTYARASSIIAKADKTREESSDSSMRLNDGEKSLLKLLSKFDIAVERAVKMVAPKWVAHYSYDVCDAFNKFYEANRVLQEQDPKLRSQRLGIVEATRNVLRQSLGLLGIDVLEKI